MKGLKSIMLLFVVLLLCGNSCERKEDKYVLTIINQSNKELVYFISSFDTVACVKPDDKRERQNMFYYKAIKPYSNRRIGMDMFVDSWQKHNTEPYFLYLYDIHDIDTMNCEEFVRTHPLKIKWELFFTDLEACDWTLVYTPADLCSN